MTSFHYNPKRCILEITYACNLRCRTCSVWTQYFIKKRGVPANLATVDIIKIQRLLAGNGLKRITYLGGEPFMRNDICDIAAQAQGLGISPAVVTNGTLVNQKIVHLVTDKKLFDIMIFSIDGPEHIHDSIRGVPGSFNLATGAIQRIQKIKKKKKLKYPRIFMYVTLSAMNYLYIEKLLSIAQQLDVESIRFLSASCLEKTIIERTNRLFKSPAVTCHNYEVPADLTIPANKRAFVRDSLLALRDRVRAIGITLQVEEILQNSKGVKSCRFLGKDFVVSPQGDIYPCPMLPGYTIGNILKTSLQDIFMNKKLENLIILSYKKKIPICSECCVEKIFP